MPRGSCVHEPLLGWRTDAQGDASMFAFNSRANQPALILTRDDSDRRTQFLSLALAPSLFISVIYNKWLAVTEKTLTCCIVPLTCLKFGSLELLAVNKAQRYDDLMMSRETSCRRCFAEYTLSSTSILVF